MPKAIPISRGPSIRPKLQNAPLTEMTVAKYSLDARAATSDRIMGEQMPKPIPNITVWIKSNQRLDTNGTLNRAKA
ncbi:hypothetical protein SAMD00079811_35410 [Scytonema sp. HK-05]|nr:hypothetical protein SAMD00079811_35410 [Scytonema sp. HK-05]